MRNLSCTLALIGMLTSNFSYAQTSSSTPVSADIQLYSFSEPMVNGAVTTVTVTPKANTSKEEAPFKYKVTSFTEAKVASIQILDRDEKCGVLGSATLAIQDQKQMITDATRLAPGLSAEVERNISKCEKLGINIIPSKSSRGNFIAKALNILIPSAEATSTCRTVAFVIMGLGVVIAVGGSALGRSDRMGVIAGVGASLGAISAGFITLVVGGLTIVGCAIFDKSSQ